MSAVRTTFASVAGGGKVQTSPRKFGVLVAPPVELSTISENALASMKRSSATCAMYVGTITKQLYNEPHDPQDNSLKSQRVVLAKLGAEITLHETLGKDMVEMQASHRFSGSVPYETALRDYDQIIGILEISRLRKICVDYHGMDPSVHPYEQAPAAQQLLMRDEYARLKYQLVLIMSTVNENSAHAKKIPATFAQLQTLVHSRGIKNHSLAYTPIDNANINSMKQLEQNIAERIELCANLTRELVENTTSAAAAAVANVLELLGVVSRALDRTAISITTITRLFVETTHTHNRARQISLKEEYIDMLDACIKIHKERLDECHALYLYTQEQIALHDTAKLEDVINEFAVPKWNTVYDSRVIYNEEAALANCMDMVTKKHALHSDYKQELMYLGNVCPVAHPINWNPITNPPQHRIVCEHNMDGKNCNGFMRMALEECGFDVPEHLQTAKYCASVHPGRLVNGVHQQLSLMCTVNDNANPATFIEFYPFNKHFEPSNVHMFPSWSSNELCADKKSTVYVVRNTSQTPLPCYNNEKNPVLKGLPMCRDLTRGVGCRFQHDNYLSVVLSLMIRVNQNHMGIRHQLLGEEFKQFFNQVIYTFTNTDQNLIKKFQNYYDARV